jgi:hypothetical protein
MPHRFLSRTFGVLCPLLSLLRLRRLWLLSEFVFHTLRACPGGCAGRRSR